MQGRKLWLRVVPKGYAEVWVGHDIDLAFGRRGRGAVLGIGRPALVRISSRVRAGEIVELAVLAWPAPLAFPRAGSVSIVEAELMLGR